MSTITVRATSLARRCLAAFTIACVATLLASPPAVAQTGEDNRVSFSETPVDLGEAQANETITRTILATNNTDKPISFTRVTTTCSCVSGAVESREIEPGDAAEVEVRLDALPVNGPLRKNLYVWIQGESRPLVLPVAAEIVGGRDPDQPAPGAAQRPTPTPSAVAVAVEPEMADLGDLRPEQARTMEVSITNTGDEPIRFTRVQSDCTCASGEITQDPIAPGDSATLTVRMEAGPNVGPLRRKLNVWAAGQRRPVTVDVQARVTYAVNAEPFFLNMIGRNANAGEIALTSTDDRPFRVLSAGCKVPVGVSDDPGKAALEHTIQWDLSDVDPADLDQFWVVRTDHPETPLLALRIIHPSIFQKLAAEQREKPWTISHDHIILGALAPGQPVERVFEFIGLRADTLDEVTSRDGLFEVEFVEKSLGRRGIEAAVKITPKVASPDAGGCMGVLKDAIIFKSGDTETEVAIFATLQAEG